MRCETQPGSRFAQSGRPADHADGDHEPAAHAGKWAQPTCYSHVQRVGRAQSYRRFAAGNAIASAFFDDGHYLDAIT